VSNPLQVVIAAQVTLGLGFVAVTLALLRFLLPRRSYGGRCIGTVTSLRAPNGSRGPARAASFETAIVRFTTDAGQEVIAACGLGPKGTGVKLGSRVTVLYDPRNPNRARLEHELGRGMLNLVLLLAGATVVEVVGLATVLLG
jgi:hypothetical protein